MPLLHKRASTDLTALLPSEQQPDALLTAADKAAEAQLNSQVILLAGSTDAETAFQTAAQNYRHMAQKRRI